MLCRRKVAAGQEQKESPKATSNIPMAIKLSVTPKGPILPQ